MGSGNILSHLRWRHALDGLKMNPTGILALWNDCAKGKEAIYERWYQTEHLAERLAIPGILRGRRYQAVDAIHSYFTYYETETPEVLISKPYREILNHPTPLTQKIMAGTLINMSRTICCVVARSGDCRGAWAVTIKLKRNNFPDTTKMVNQLAGNHGTARVELWHAVEKIKPPLSKEEKIRGCDDRILGCLLIDTLRETDARKVAKYMKKMLGGAVKEAAIYRLMCELEG